METWEPRFTYHGFQYIQVTGFPGIPTIDSLCGRVVHTAFESLGSFECSNELLNKIQQCARWSTLTNYHGIPTDCPHREKNGWTGDAALSAEQVLLNFNPMTAYIKWLQDFKDIQRPSGQLPGIVPTGGWGFNWGSAVLLIPWCLYVYCGDVSVLENMYDSMKNYVDFMTSMADEHIVDFGLGDWCPPTGGFDVYKCPSAVTDTAYYYGKLVEQVEVQGRHIDCGILGAKYVMHLLTGLGRADLAYIIATQTTFPGWGHWIVQGATSLWETWEGDASRNHHMFSDISAWFYKGLAGINPDPGEPGFKHIIFRPNPVEGLEWVRSSHECMYGTIICNWKVNAREFSIQVTVPANSHATLYLPKGYAGDITEGGNPIGAAPEIKVWQNEEGMTILGFGSGEYDFSIKMVD